MPASRISARGRHCMVSLNTAIQSGISFLGLGGKRIKEYEAKAKEQHEMKGEQPKIVERDCTVHPEKEIEHQSEFQDHIRRKFLGKILIALPAVGKIVDIEFWGPYKLASFPHMTFQDRHRIVEGKAQSHRKEGKKQFDVIHEFIETASLDALLCKPIANKENNCAYNKETRNLKDPSKMSVHVFNVKHWDT